ncbi:WYL domain-containing protein [Vibrio parahaemolyticus]|nr:WYL domain-containing protein [Vibrio parahaemolyticus]
MLAIINDDEQWAEYCIEKKLTPSAQKFALKTYGIKKDPVEIPSQASNKSNAKQSSLFTVSDSSSTDIDDEDAWKKYDSIEDWKNDLTVIWSGTTDDIEFSYRKDWDSPKERRNVTPLELVFDGNKRIYIKGLCHKRNETVHFNQDKIETKILAGSTRYEFYEWVERRLKVDVEALSDKYKVWI